MKISIAALSLALIVAGCSSDPAPTSSDVVAFLEANTQGADQAKISLDACHLKISFESDVKGPNAIALLSKAVLMADLSKFDFQTVGIRPLPDGGSVLIAKWLETAEYPTPLASKLLEFSTQSHKDFQPGELTLKASDGSVSEEKRMTPSDLQGADAQDLVDLFQKPGGTVSFRLTSLMTGDANGVTQLPTPHEDGPAFHAFAENALTLEKPEALLVNLTFLGDTAAPDQLFGGLVTIPRQLTFSVGSDEKAKELTGLFYHYVQGSCRT
ncbi:hypothetical protein [Labrenzia sp. VG12]|uniref:hypothetical protein n=1 Tax=Labrenzia sp. VG12 TaxID=2021862 RepID=UPI000B8C2AFE|nr:hypothetical protein [Labrenzia sp. VG12]ASP34415.1 hypothetical protein CHH27_15140 [Labrenzia sp. VG12]